MRSNGAPSQRLISATRPCLYAQIARRVATAVRSSISSIRPRLMRINAGCAGSRPMRPSNVECCPGAWEHRDRIIDAGYPYEIAGRSCMCFFSTWCASGKASSTPSARGLLTIVAAMRDSSASSRFTTASIGGDRDCLMIARTCGRLVSAFIDVRATGVSPKARGQRYVTPSSSTNPAGWLPRSVRCVQWTPSRPAGFNVVFARTTSVRRSESEMAHDVHIRVDLNSVVPTDVDHEGTMDAAARSVPQRADARDRSRQRSLRLGSAGPIRNRANPPDRICPSLRSERMPPPGAPHTGGQPIVRAGPIRRSRLGLRLSFARRTCQLAACRSLLTTESQRRRAAARVWRGCG